MIRVTVFDTTTRRWTDIPNGPFPITEAELRLAQTRYQDEWKRCPDLTGVKMAPQTTARAILREIKPSLSDFDGGMLGFAVSNTRVRIEEVF